MDDLQHRQDLSTPRPPSTSVRHAIRRQTPSAAASGAVAEDVADDGVDGPVGELHGVVEVAAQQRAPAAGPVVGGQQQLGVGDQRRRKQAALEAGVLLLVHARELELLAGLLGAPALDRVADARARPCPSIWPLTR